MDTLRGDYMAKTTILEGPVKSNETVTKAQEDALSAEEIAKNKKVSDLYREQAAAVQNQAAVLAQNQQAATDLAVSQLEQRKTQLKEDYKKEQSAAYTDYQKQINPYGANAEVMADNGLTNSGYSESSKVRMYNEYQQRVAMNKSTLDAAIANFDTAIAEAKLQNSSVLAQMAFDAFEQEVALLKSADLYEMKGPEATVPDEVGGISPPEGYSATGEQQMYMKSDGTLASAVIYVNSAGERMFYNEETGQWVKDRGSPPEPAPSKTPVPNTRNSNSALSYKKVQMTK